MGSKYKMTRKDWVYLLIFFLALGVTIGYDIFYNGFSGVGRLIEQVIILILSFVTLVDVAYCFNWNILVPDFFVHAKEEKHKKEAESYIEEYIKEDINFFQDQSEEKISFIMSQLGINKNQLDKIRLELIKMRCMPLKTLDDAKRKLECLAKNDEPIVIDQKRYDSSKICYKEVRYYINTMDIMFIPDYASELSSVLAFLISENADLQAIDKLVIPYDSNFLLGVEVGRQLGKPIVKMRKGQGKILTEQCWDGKLSPGERVIIIHDVLVSGEQIIDTIHKLSQKNCSIEGFFCLITRTGPKLEGREKVCEALGEKRDHCYEVLTIGDDEIAALRRK